MNKKWKKKQTPPPKNKTYLMFGKDAQCVGHLHAGIKSAWDDHVVANIKINAKRHVALVGEGGRIVPGRESVLEEHAAVHALGSGLCSDLEDVESDAVLVLFASLQAAVIL